MNPPAGLVLWGALEALATVVIFLCGWAASAHLPLLAAYRYVALGLSYILGNRADGIRPRRVPRASARALVAAQPVAGRRAGVAVSGYRRVV